MLIYCSRCDREFRNQAALNQHIQMSAIHQPVQQSVKCPVCAKNFSRMSEMASHMETHATRAAIEQYVRGTDKNNIITRPMIEWNSNQQDFSNYTSAQLARDCQVRGGYECPYDECNFKIFATPSNLWSHVNSKRHCRMAYHCPGCAKQYVSIGGLFKHFEYGCSNASGAAQGFQHITNSMSRLRIGF